MADLDRQRLVQVRALAASGVETAAVSLYQEFGLQIARSLRRQLDAYGVRDIDADDRPPPPHGEVPSRSRRLRRCLRRRRHFESQWVADVEEMEKRLRRRSRVVALPDVTLEAYLERDEPA